MVPERLWAKSWDEKRQGPPPVHVFLSRHLCDVHAASKQILDITAKDQLHAIGLPAREYEERFGRIVRLAAVLHDLGKANNHFQGMLTWASERRGKPQGLRHEWISVLLVREKLRQWLLPAVNGNETDLNIVEWAIGGHHPKFGRETPPKPGLLDGASPEVIVHTNHVDFHDCLELVRSPFPAVGAVPCFAEPWVIELTGDNSAIVRLNHGWLKHSNGCWNRLGELEQRLVAAAKATLVAADVAGSALPVEVETEETRLAWIANSLSNVPQAGELEAIVERRLEQQRAQQHNPSIQLRQFQKDIGVSRNNVTLAKAGCGSGKTLAAYHWAATNHPHKRLWFCYPTTGTATEGFRDYLNNPEEQWNYRLFHGRAAVDMALIVNEDYGSATGSRDETTEEAEAADRIESLDAWSTPVVSCTVDTVLGLIQNNRRGIYAWPALAGAAFVFDEIHAYDDRLFGALLWFLEALPGLPTLLMTASLPEARLEQLRESLVRAGRESLAEISGPPDLENQPRYHREAIPTELSSLDRRVSEEYASGGKILWVCNTVQRAMDAADRLAALGLKPEVYHSRFRYCDRVQRHGAVVDAFKSSHTGPVVACTTQVCEMSLDLEGVTLLVTELAPISALIQRLGRLNRKAKADDPTRPFIVIDDPGTSSLPYDEKELQAAREWLEELPTTNISQSHLADAWKDQPSATDDVQVVGSAWLQGGPITTVMPLRDGSNGITVIREADLPAMKKYEQRMRHARLSGEKLTELERRPREDEQTLVNVAIPMPQHSGDWREWPRHQNLPVAPDDQIDYCPLRGATWKNA